ncbi:MAG TPA: hypothetical protein VF195_04510 [Actinomycetota bacterium]
MGPRRHGGGHGHRSGGGHQYSWWIDVERPGRFSGLGNLGQYPYVAPDADAVIVRNGSDWNIDNDTWLGTFREIADQLAQSAG